MTMRKFQKGDQVQLLTPDSGSEMGAEFAGKVGIVEGYQDGWVIVVLDPKQVPEGHEDGICLGRYDMFCDEDDIALLEPLTASMIVMYKDLPEEVADELIDRCGKIPTNMFNSQFILTVIIEPIV